ncbi:TPA: alpha/beta hydrolase fold domain-containing protein, partial [Pseudomonas aeruginosa]
LLPADAEPGSAALSPLHADLAGLPPLLVQVGEDELLRDDSLRLAQRAGEQGVAVRLQRYAGCWHVFQAHAGVLASADRALDEAAAFVVECSAEGDRCRTS